MTDKIPDFVTLYKHYTSVSPIESKYVLELYQAQYDKSDGEKYYHEAEVKRLRDALELARVAIENINIAAKDSGFVTDIRWTQQTLTAIDAALGDSK